MPRIARVVVPHYPHHVTQRGNRRQRTFFCDGDFRNYLALMAEWCDCRGVEIWAYCLMPNHVHLIAVPNSADALRRGIGEAHRRYTRMVNFRKRWRGHLWQGRFASFVLDDDYLLATARYVELNPVRAGIVRLPQDYPWSSAPAHLKGRDDELVKTAPLLAMINGWRKFLSEPGSNDTGTALHRHERTGRPLGSERFLTKLERRLDRVLKPKKPGRKPKRPQE